MTKLFLLLFLALQSVWATTVTGTIYMADGTFARGFLHISWSTFKSGDKLVMASSKTLRLVLGAFSVDLEPGTYTVVYRLEMSPETRVYWEVPSTSSVEVSLIQSTSGSPPVLLGLTSLNGLTQRVQTFAISTSCVSPSVTSAAGVHTFCIPPTADNLSFSSPLSRSGNAVSCPTCYTGTPPAAPDYSFVSPLVRVGDTISCPTCSTGAPPAPGGTASHVYKSTDFAWSREYEITVATDWQTGDTPTISLDACPLGVRPLSSGRLYVRITGGTGDPETVYVIPSNSPGSATTCLGISDGAGAIQLSALANNHTGTITISSGTVGIQEAVNYGAASTTQAYVLIPEGNHTLYGQVSVVSYIEKDGGGLPLNYYTRNVHISGSGRAATVVTLATDLLSESAPVAGFRLTNAHDGLFNHSAEGISDISIVNNCVTCTSVYIDGVQHAHPVMSNVSIFGGYDGIVSSYGSNDNAFDQIFIIDQRRHGFMFDTTGVGAPGGAYFITNSLVASETIQSAGAGLYNYTTSNSYDGGPGQVINLTVWAGATNGGILNGALGGRGIYIYGAGGKTTMFLLCTTCVVDGYFNSAGIAMVNAKDVHYTANSWCVNQQYRENYGCVYIRNSEKITYNDSTAYSPYMADIHFEAQDTEVNNTIKIVGSSMTGPSGYNYLITQAGNGAFFDFRIEGNAESHFGTSTWSNNLLVLDNAGAFNSRKRSLNFGLFASLPSALQGYPRKFERVPYNCYIYDYAVMTNPSITLSIDIYKNTYDSLVETTSWPPGGGASSVGTASTSSTFKNRDRTLTNWNRLLSAEDVLIYRVTTASGAGVTTMFDLNISCITK